MKEKFAKVIEQFKNKTEKECYSIKCVEGTPNILDDKIEFVSLSGLVSGLSKEDILRGVSQTQKKSC